MIAVDTNVIIRFIVRDDPDQARLARSVIENHACFVPESVVLECAWVLEYVYSYSKPEVAVGLRTFLGLKNVHVDQPSHLWQTIEWYEEGLDFADAFHLAQCQHLVTLVTFDQQFRKVAFQKGTCQISHPAEISAEK